VFAGTRVPQALMDYLEGGHSLDEFLDDFPSVSRDQAVAALEALHPATRRQQVRSNAWLVYSILGFALAGCATKPQPEQGTGNREPKTDNRNTTVRPVEIEYRYADVNGVRLHYAEAGDGKLVLFLHGFPEFWYAWKDQLSEFGKDHRAVAVDMRGYNLSSKPPEVEAYRVATLVEDVKQLADQLSSKRFVLVGHDWGGVVAWSFAIAHPDRLEKLVIINAPHPAIFGREIATNPAQQQASLYMLGFRAPGAEAALSANNYAALVDGILGEGLKQGYISQQDRAAYIEAWSQPGALTGGLNYYRASGVGSGPAAGGPTGAGSGAPQTASMSVRVPTLVIWGERDQYLLTGNLKGLEEFVSDLRIEQVPDAGHWIVHEKRELVNGVIRGFLSGRGW